MLSGHPHIKSIRVSETYGQERVRRRLVVDTDLLMPLSGRIEENERLLDLHNYLEQIALHDFADFDEVEIRTPKPAYPVGSFHERERRTA